MLTLSFKVEFLKQNLNGDNLNFERKRCKSVTEYLIFKSKTLRVSLCQFQTQKMENIFNIFEIGIRGLLNVNQIH